MKLSVNAITGGRYFKAFEDDIPDSVIPENLRKYAVVGQDDGKLQAQRAEADSVEAPRRHVLRGRGAKSKGKGAK